jgi:iron(III) transport system permease protein
VRNLALALALLLVAIAGAIPAAFGIVRGFRVDVVAVAGGGTERGIAVSRPALPGADPTKPSSVRLLLEREGPRNFPRHEVREVRADAVVLVDGRTVTGAVTETPEAVRVVATAVEFPGELVREVRRRAAFTTAHAARALSDPFAWEVTAWTAGIALLGTLGAVLLGVPFALFTARTDLPGRGLFTALYAAPLVLPPLLGAMAWDNLLPYSWIEGPESLGRWGTVLQAAALFSLAYFPLVALFARRGLASVGAAAEEAALLAAGPWAALRRVTLPLARPGIVLGALFTFVFCLNDFSVVDYLNIVRTPSRQVSVYPYLIQITFAQRQGGEERLLVAGLPLAILSLSVAAVAIRSASGTIATIGSSWRPPRPIRLGPLGRAAGWALCGGALAAGVLVPVLALLGESKGWGAFARTFGKDSVAASLRLSLGLAAGAVVLSVPASLVLVDAGRRLGRDGGAFVAGLVLLPLVLVPALVPIGAMEIWDRPIFTTTRGGAPWNPIYDTPLLAALVTFARVFPFALAAAWASYREAEPSQAEAAEVAGVPWDLRLRRVVLPLARPGVALGGLLAFVFAVRELDALAVLKTKTLLGNLWAQLHFMRDETVAAMAVVLVALLAFAFGAAATTGWLRPRGR